MNDRLNIYAPDFARRRDEILDALLHEAPIHWHDPVKDYGDATARPGTTFAPRGFYGRQAPYWTVARYDDVIAIKRNPEVFSNTETITWGMTPGTFEWEVGHRRLSANDGEYHDVVRRLCGKQMRPTVLRTYTDALRDKARRGLDGFEAKLRSGATVDWVREFAYMFPVYAVGLLIGLPEALMDRFADGFAAGNPPTDDELEQSFREFVGERVKQPADDMASELIAAVNDGSPYLQIEKLHYNLLGFYLAGHLTTTHLMAWVLVELQRHPELRTILRENHDLIPGFIEETLRVDPPVVATFNNVLRDHEMNGHHFRAGDHVYSVYGAANRDPSVFPEPHRFDITRTPNPHLAFSHGTHFCLGAPLARLETRLMLEDLLHRDLPLSVDYDNAVRGQNTFASLKVSLG